MVQFQVTSAWQGQTRSRPTVESFRIGGQEVRRHFDIEADEPCRAARRRTPRPNPQELLMTALNACIMVGYVVGAAMRASRSRRVEIETRGAARPARLPRASTPSVPPGYESIHYTVRMKGDGTPEQFREIHQTVHRRPRPTTSTSPARSASTPGSRSRRNGGRADAGSPASARHLGEGSWTVAVHTRTNGTPASRFASRTDSASGPSKTHTPRRPSFDR